MFGAGRGEFLRLLGVASQRVDHQGGVLGAVEHDALLCGREHVLRRGFHVLEIAHLQRSLGPAVGVELGLPCLALRLLGAFLLGLLVVDLALSVVPRIQRLGELLFVVVRAGQRGLGAKLHCSCHSIT